MSDYWARKHHAVRNVPELRWTWKDEDNRFEVLGQPYLQRDSDELFHNPYVEGRALQSLNKIYTRPEEWIPDLLPAPVRLANAGGVHGAQQYGDQSLQSLLSQSLSPPRSKLLIPPRSTKISSAVGDDINYFSDEPEPISSVFGDQEPETNGENQQLIRRPSQNSLLLGNEISYRVPRITLSPPHSQQSLLIVAGQEMAGRGRGRGGGGGGGMLKGATWEYDATIKLESKPTDLFPVSIHFTSMRKCSQF